MTAAEDLLICFTCGTQFDVPLSRPLRNCRVCDDPRQFVPPGGQKWTSLAQMRAEGYENKWTRDSVDDRVWFVQTEPKFAIGQRAFLLQTPHGNVLWDCISLIDDKTVEFVKSKGGLKAIVISHPHFYTTHLEWARAFDCPVYTSAEDRNWLNQDEDKRRVVLRSRYEVIVPGVTAIKTGGHFDGSLVLHWENKLFTADSMMITPSALYHENRLPGTTSFTFMWSYPNMIPLAPSALALIWDALKPFEFDTAHGVFPGLDVRDPTVKRRIFASMKIQIRAEGHSSHALLVEGYPS